LAGALGLLISDESNECQAGVCAWKGCVRHMFC
jgi:hypothetical protein